MFFFNFGCISHLNQANSLFSLLHKHTARISFFSTPLTQLTEDINDVLQCLTKKKIKKLEKHKKSFEEIYDIEKKANQL